MSSSESPEKHPDGGVQQAFDIRISRSNAIGWDYGCRNLQLKDSG